MGRIDENIKSIRLMMEQIVADSRSSIQ